ncbi:MAG: diphosphomevalonate decarboxylase [Myxococcales bacterium]|nr:diphosphomevalonate decarboxylase [Myxococcales bacterium]
MPADNACSATAIAHPNIALCKYWGKRDAALNLPSTPSLSLTLAPFRTRTTVTWGAETDCVVFNGVENTGEESRKILLTLDRVARSMATAGAPRPPCRVETENDFPTAAGLASSASGFAALVVAADAAARTRLPDATLAALARQGSGSATRSLQGGWVEWPIGERPDGADSHGRQIAAADHWDVRMLVVLVRSGPKEIGSTEGMNHTMRTSPYYPAWVAGAAEDVVQARAAVLGRDLERLGRVTERSALRMHASMIAADPAVLYWKPETLLALEVVRAARRSGVPAWATMDAGPNVKVLCEAADSGVLVERLRGAGLDVQVLVPGGPARLLEPATATSP